MKPNTSTTTPADRTAQHTPGPWKQYRHSSIIEAADGEQIAMVRCLAWPDDKALANARLLAAAPELLGALESLLRNATDKARYIATLESPARDIEAANSPDETLDSPEMAQARSTLRKAKGEA